MPFELFLRSKKAQGGSGSTEESGSALRGTVLSIMVVLVVVSIIFNFSGALFAQEAGEGTPETFKKFVEALNFVANGTKDVAVVSNMALGSAGYIFAVFDTGSNYAKDTCQSNEDFAKPSQCGGKLCAAICHEDYACTNPFDFAVIESKDIGEAYGEPIGGFDANLGGAYKGDRGKAFVLIYADCDGSGGEPLGIRDVVIERVGNAIRISDDSCGNIKDNGKVGKCTKAVKDRPACPAGESPVSSTIAKCEKEKGGPDITCCI